MMMMMMLMIFQGKEDVGRHSDLGDSYNAVNNNIQANGFKEN